MIWSCCELMTGLCVAEELVFLLCNCTHLLGSPWQEGGREQVALLPARLMAFFWEEWQERSPLSRACSECCVPGACGAVFPCLVRKVLPAPVVAFSYEYSCGKTT